MIDPHERARGDILAYPVLNPSPGLVSVLEAIQGQEILAVEKETPLILRRNLNLRERGRVDRQQQ